MFFSIVWNKIEISPIYGFISRGKSFGTIFNFLYINIYWSKYDFMINSWSYHNCLICPFLLCYYAPQFKCRNACLAIRGHTSFWCVLSNHEVMYRNCDKSGSHSCWKGPKILNPKPPREDLSCSQAHRKVLKIWNSLPGMPRSVERHYDDLRYPVTWVWRRCSSLLERCYGEAPLFQNPAVSIISNVYLVLLQLFYAPYNEMYIHVNTNFILVFYFVLFVST
jgi:hypothetical protein